MAGWHHWLDGRESGWTPGVGDGQGGLACCDSWGRKESDTTELNWSPVLILQLLWYWILSLLANKGLCCYGLFLACMKKPDFWSLAWHFVISLLNIKVMAHFYSSFFPTNFVFFLFFPLWYYILNNFFAYGFLNLLFVIVGWFCGWIVFLSSAVATTVLEVFHIWEHLFVPFIFDNFPASNRIE